MKIWKDKQGNKLTAQEFLARWKQGMQQITPLQQAKTTQRAYYIMLIGILAGVITAWMNKQWWLAIILCAATITQLVSMLGNWQKIQVLKQYQVPVPQTQNIKTEDAPKERDYIQ